MLNNKQKKKIKIKKENKKKYNKFVANYLEKKLK